MLESAHVNSREIPCVPKIGYNLKDRNNVQYDKKRKIGIRFELAMWYSLSKLMGFIWPIQSYQRHYSVEMLSLPVCTKIFTVALFT